MPRAWRDRVGDAGVSRPVPPEAILVTQTPLSITWAIHRPSGLQEKAESMRKPSRVTCRGSPPVGDIGP